MKVIKKGFENAHFGKEFVCKGHGLGSKVGGCGAVLHVVPADICVFNDYDVDSTYWFVCPECGAKTSIKYDAFK